MGDVLSIPSARKALADIMAEVLITARATLPPPAAELLQNSVIDAIIEHENPKSVFKPSMLVDLEAGRPMEVEAIVGGVLRRAQEAMINVPKLEIIYASLCVLQNGILKNRSHVP